MRRFAPTMTLGVGLIRLARYAGREAPTMVASDRTTWLLSGPECSHRPEGLAKLKAKGQALNDYCRNAVHMPIRKCRPTESSSPLSKVRVYGNYNVAGENRRSVSADSPAICEIVGGHRPPLQCLVIYGPLH
jgi:hypothetical protein